LRLFCYTEGTMNFTSPKGTRDFLPEQNYLRRKIVKTLKDAFVLYGFEPWDGPSFENIETLTAKSGPEIEKEIYTFIDKGGRKMGLRFELTASLARIIAQNRSLKKPLKLFNIGKVWRYERPQAGRFREFVQADCDIFGVKEMTAEAELINMALKICQNLGLKNTQIYINDRQIITNFLSLLELSTKQKNIMRCLDKLYKIGQKAVEKELKSLNIKEKDCQKIFQFINTKGTNQEKLEKAKTTTKNLKEILRLTKNRSVIVDFSLTRGLDYYTGPIFEIKLGKEKVESIAGGGRYDNLIKEFGGENTPACGISFGIERLYEILGKNKEYKPSALVYIAYLNQTLLPKAIDAAEKLRDAGINTDIALKKDNLSAQLDFANKKQIPYVLIIFSEKEMKFKDMKSGRERKITIGGTIKKLLNPL